MASSVAHAPVFSFSTAAFAERDRLSAWREVVCRTIISVDIEPREVDGFRSNATVCQMPGLGVVFVDSVAMHMTHTRELIRDDNLSFMAAPTCHWLASQAGRDPICMPGQGMLMNNAEIGSITLASDTRFTSFSIPRAALAPLVSNLDAAIAQPIPSDNAALRLLVNYLDSARDCDALSTPELRELTVAHVYDLVAMAIGATRDAAEIAEGRGVRAGRLRAAKAFVRRELSCEDLSAATVAAHLGVTPRYVHMLFEAENLSFSEFVIAKRLALAHCMLVSPRFNDRAISAIAFEAGFNDLSHFNRTFRRHFHATPSEVRRQAGRERE
jgi:AraC-like DNA-binding protein